MQSGCKDIKLQWTLNRLHCTTHFVPCSGAGMSALTTSLHCRPMSKCWVFWIFAKEMWWPWIESRRNNMRLVGVDEAPNNSSLIFVAELLQKVFQLSDILDGLITPYSRYHIRSATKDYHSFSTSLTAEIPSLWSSTLLLEWPKPALPLTTIWGTNSEVYPESGMVSSTQRDSTSPSTIWRRSFWITRRPNRMPHRPWFSRLLQQTFGHQTPTRST